MARRFSGFRQNLVRQGRKTFWFAGAFTNVNLPSASSSSLITSLTAGALALRPFTIIRTRGIWGVRSDQVSVDENQFVGYGSIVVSDEAVAIGITAVPTPVTSMGSSWIHLDFAAQHLNAASDIGLHPDMIPHRYVIDSKSMRKVEEGQDLVEVIQNSAISNGAQVVSMTRILIKLH